MGLDIELSVLESVIYMRTLYIFESISSIYKSCSSNRSYIQIRIGRKHLNLIG
jgi:hypothetical protein